MLVTSCWITKTWQDMSEFGIRLLPNTGVPRQLRGADQFLMESFWEAGLRDELIRHALNECRMFVHAVSLADIANAAGTHICEDAWTCRQPCGHRSSFDWPLMHAPSAWMVATWQNALELTFGVDRRFHRLPQTLGPFEPDEIFSQWLYSPATDRLLLRKDDYQWLAFP